MAKVKITITGTYDLVPKFYKGCNTPQEMMKLDQDNENLGIEGLIESLGDTVQTKWEVVEE